LWSWWAAAAQLQQHPSAPTHPGWTLQLCRPEHSTSQQDTTLKTRCAVTLAALKLECLRKCARTTSEAAAAASSSSNAAPCIMASSNLSCSSSTSAYKRRQQQRPHLQLSVCAIQHGARVGSRGGRLFLLFHCGDYRGISATGEKPCEWAAHTSSGGGGRHRASSCSPGLRRSTSFFFWASLN
jgi:hypothetical protein